MFKCFRIIVVCLMVIGLAAVAPPVRAVSADMMLVHIQAGAVGAAMQEVIVLFNNSPAAVNITDYCLTNKNNVVIACFTTQSPEYAAYVPGHSYAVVASNTYADASELPLSSFAMVYEPINQTSGSLTGSSDTISLIDSSGQLVDQHSWSSSLAAGMSAARMPIGGPTMGYIDTDTAQDWNVLTLSGPPANQTVTLDFTPSDTCPNIDGLQLAVPPYLFLDEWGECVPFPEEESAIRPLRITELLPNAPGSDDGQEFIELYNPNDEAVSLSGYVLQVGPSFERSHTLPDVLLGPGSYYVISNAEVGFILLNTSSRVRLVTIDQLILSETPPYHNPKDGMAWALLGDVWQYTNTPTPGSDNQASVDMRTPTATKGSMLKPCASNQYRNPATNRCRLIASTTTSLKPCAPHQVRNPATNRCRNNVQVTERAPCKEGQERNPETNRCRMVKQMPAADYGVLGAATTQEPAGWYIWIAVGLVVIAALAYGIWEWRAELRRIGSRLQQVLRRR